jgi:hypothetical protein
MNEDPEVRPPTGQDESASVELGEPTSEPEGEEREERRPDLDERDRRISTRRKPMGPPLQEPEEAREDEFEREEREPAERPVDPA